MQRRSHYSGEGVPMDPAPERSRGDERRGDAGVAGRHDRGKADQRNGSRYFLAG
jgi:hypothetical protein